MFCCIFFFYSSILSLSKLLWLLLLVWKWYSNTISYHKKAKSWVCNVYDVYFAIITFTMSSISSWFVWIYLTWFFKLFIRFCISSVFCKISYSIVFFLVPLLWTSSVRSCSFDICNWFWVFLKVVEFYFPLLCRICLLRCQLKNVFFALYIFRDQKYCCYDIKGSSRLKLTWLGILLIYVHLIRISRTFVNRFLLVQPAIYTNVIKLKLIFLNGKSCVMIFTREFALLSLK